MRQSTSIHFEPTLAASMLAKQAKLHFVASMQGQKMWFD